MGERQAQLDTPWFESPFFDRRLDESG